MDVHALNCPNCGAPLKVPGGHDLALCLYCDTTVRISRSESEPARATAEAQAAPETIREVKQLLMDGKREAALALYREAVHAGEAEAAEVLDSLAREVSLSVMLTQRLSGLGVIFILAYLAAIAWSVLAGLNGAISPALAVIIVLVALALLWPFARGPWITLRYLGAPLATATVQRIAPIGTIRNIHVFRLLVDVQPRSAAAAFQTHMSVPVREQSLRHMQPGLRMQVRYLRGDPNSLLFDKVIESAGSA